jgi:RNA polymerase sigma factor (sigma-70 family)
VGVFVVLVGVLAGAFIVLVGVSSLGCSAYSAGGFITRYLLGEVCTIERGGSPRPITDYITDSEDGINWIKIGDAQEGSKYITSTKEKIRPEGIKKSRFVHKGDFILSNSMSFGRPYILKVDGCIHDGWLVIHDDNEVFIKDYLYYILSSSIMYAKFSQLAVGGVVNNLNSSLVRKVAIPISPKSTQLSIVSDLTDGVGSHLVADEYFDGDATQAALQEAIATLPDVQRVVFNLRYYEEMKYSEMSSLLNTSEGSLKASYHIAVKKIYNHLLSKNT